MGSDGGAEHRTATGLRRGRRAVAFCRVIILQSAFAVAAWYACGFEQPKKAANVQTDVTEDVVREVLLPTGLVDNKVAAVDETWSGLKLVVRLELR